MSLTLYKGRVVCFCGWIAARVPRDSMGFQTSGFPGSQISQIWPGSGRALALGGPVAVLCWGARRPPPRHSTALLRAHPRPKPGPTQDRFEISGNLEIQKFGIPWNPCDKDFRILDRLEPLRQRFQNFGPTGTLASKISRFPNNSGNTFHLRDNAKAVAKLRRLVLSTFSV